MRSCRSAASQTQTSKPGTARVRAARRHYPKLATGHSPAALQGSWAPWSRGTIGSLTPDRHCPKAQRLPAERQMAELRTAAGTTPRLRPPLAKRRRRRSPRGPPTARATSRTGVRPPAGCSSGRSGPASCTSTCPRTVPPGPRRATARSGPRRAPSAPSAAPTTRRSRASWTTAASSWAARRRRLPAGPFMPPTCCPPTRGCSRAPQATGGPSLWSPAPRCWWTAGARATATRCACTTARS
mmetsp:Transcript_160036/g.489526  ORF Transcript_160036/g.489526 Transcript_160036/m.489526 type:complete len:241 (-) Transcript_160036:39-761(-)